VIDTEGERGQGNTDMTYKYLQMGRGETGKNKYKSLEYTLGESCVSILIIYVFHFKFFKNQNLS